jgi:hypothetical protein
MKLEGLKELVKEELKRALGDHPKHMPLENIRSRYLQSRLYNRRPC